MTNILTIIKNIWLGYESYPLFHNISFQKAMRDVDDYSKLLATKIKKGDYVALDLDRSETQIIIILALWKIGAIYIPINSKDGKKNSDILDAIHINFIITNNPSNPLYTKLNSSQIIDIKDLSLLNNLAVQNLDQPTINDIAYIIFTSGTTGTPKAVPIKHKNVINLLHYLQKYLKNNQHNNVIYVAPIGFDAGIWELCTALATCSAIYPCPEIIKINPKEFSQFLIDNKINLISAVPSLINQIPKENIFSLNTIIMGGEVCSKDLLEFWINHCTIYNSYGLTETTICATMHRFSKDNLQVNILGEPIDNTEIKILSSTKETHSNGYQNQGEIIISGDCVFEGYLNNIELNQQKQIILDGKIYFKTGDIGAYNQQNQLIFLGREDKQIKINGYIIDVVAIEKAINQYPNLHTGILTPHILNDNKIMVALILPNSDFNLIDFKNWLVDTLLPHQIPQEILTLNKIPYNINEKIDYKEIAKIIDKHFNAHSQQLITLEDLQKIYMQCIKNVSLNHKQAHNFYDLGGTSFNALEISVKLATTYNITLSLADILSNPHIEDVFNLILTKSQHKNKYKCLLSTPKEQCLDMQKQLWIIQNISNINLLNEFCVIKSKNLINKDILHKALLALANKYPILRASFHYENSNVYTIINDDVSYTISEYSQDNFALEENFLEHKFNLAKAPLLKFSIHHSKEGDFLVILAHHIILDGQSLHLFIFQLNQAYYSILENTHNPLNYSYQENDCKYMLLEYDKEEIINKWKAYLHNHKPLNLGNPISKKAHRYYFDIPQLNRLNHIAQKYRITLFTIILSNVFEALYKYGNQSNITIGTVSRLNNCINLTNSMGYYLNSLPIHLDNINPNNYIDLLKNTHQALLFALENNFISFAQLVSALKPIDRNTMMPFFNVVCNFENTGTLNNIKEWELFDTKNIKLNSLFAKYDVLISIELHNNQLRGFLDVREDISSDLINLLINNMKNLGGNFE
jgi:amino acid adenylation domain-containing protein